MKFKMNKQVQMENKFKILFLKASKQENDTQIPEFYPLVSSAESYLQQLNSFSPSVNIDLIEMDTFN